MKASLLIDSPVPVYSVAGRLYTLDLWVHDLQTTKLFYSRVGVIANVIHVVELNAPEYIDLPPTIQCFPRNSHALRQVRKFDLIQLNGNIKFSSSLFSAMLFFCAKLRSKKIVMGISSNRAKTHLMNTSDRWIQRIKGRVQYLNIRIYQVLFGYAVDGVFVVGDGLLKLLPKQQQNVHVSYASWIQQKEINSPPEFNPTPLHFKFAIASRLEKMKGIDLGLLALSVVKNCGHSTFSVEIAGIGPELNCLKESTETHNLMTNIQFVGSIPYDKFHVWLSNFHYLICTNLNNEQPRIIFDALQAGCLPIYPLIDSYISLGLPKELGYTQGDPDDLARVILNVIGDSQYRTAEMYFNTLNLLRSFTLDEMHRKRALWIESKVMNR